MAAARHGLRNLRWWCTRCDGEVPAPRVIGRCLLPPFQPILKCAKCGLVDDPDDETSAADSLFEVADCPKCGQMRGANEMLTSKRGVCFDHD